MMWRQRDCVTSECITTLTYHNKRKAVFTPLPFLTRESWFYSAEQYHAVLPPQYNIHSTWIKDVGYTEYLFGGVRLHDFKKRLTVLHSHGVTWLSSRGQVWFQVLFEPFWKAGRFGVCVKMKNMRVILSEPRVTPFKVGLCATFWRRLTQKPPH